MFGAKYGLPENFTVTINDTGVLHRQPPIINPVARIAGAVCA
jgi:hypothetical protein